MKKIGQNYPFSEPSWNRGKLHPFLPSLKCKLTYEAKNLKGAQCS